jgi:hypothetical protein
MSALPANYLSKKGGQYRPIKLTDLVTLIYNVAQGAREESVGFEDASRTLEMMLRSLERRTLIDPVLLESALWSCSLMNESNKFWDAKGRSLNDYIKQVLGGSGDKLHPVYHTIGGKDD